ncbi:MAG: hypothetical protein HQL33_12955 [Alphaproteobacteria bacterium]|nr:hypothetical protein [Alphaproteobacteria bacterium]MBF0130889.1 hypothetical protein [Alphaproteobacteria bacterium]
MAVDRGRNGSYRFLALVAGLLSLTLVAASLPRTIVGTILAVTQSPDGRDLAGGSCSRLLTAQDVYWSFETAGAIARFCRPSDPLDLLDVGERLLGRAPLTPDVWLRRAEMLLADGHPRQALAAWRMSVVSARVEPFIMPRRMDMGLSLRAQMGDADLELLRHQLRLTFILRPSQAHQIIALPHNLTHADFYRAVIAALTPSDIEHMVRIHALH